MASPKSVMSALNDKLSKIPDPELKIVTRQSNPVNRVSAAEKLARASSVASRTSGLASVANVADVAGKISGIRKGTYDPLKETGIRKTPEEL